MEHDIPFGNSNRENGPSFLDFPLFLGIFQWDEPTKRVPFTAQPEISEILTKWKAPRIYFRKVFYFLLYFIRFWSDLVRVLATTGNSSAVAGYRVFSHDVTAAILVSTMKRRPCWCPKPILWELNSFHMQTFSFVPMNLHRCWPLEWKHYMLYTLYSIHENSRASIPEKLRHCQRSKVIYMAHHFNHRWK